MLPQIYQWILWTPFIGEESNMVSMLNITKVHVFYWRGPVLVLPGNLDYLGVQTPWIIGCLERGLCLSSLLCLLFSFSGWRVNHFVSLHAATMKCHPYLRPKSLELLTLNRNIQESKSNNNFHFEFNCLRYYSIMTSWINCLVHKHEVWLVKTHKNMIWQHLLLIPTQLWWDRRQRQENLWMFVSHLFLSTTGSD